MVSSLQPHKSDAMPTQPDASKPAQSSAATRYLFLFLLGLVVGAIAVVMILRAVEARKTWRDRYPDAVMHVMDAQMQQLSASTKANRCAATDTLPRLQSLRSLANDIEPAFGQDMSEDQRFTDHASKLRQTLDAALAAPPLNCDGVQATMKRIGEACKACHQEFRS